VCIRPSVYLSATDRYYIETIWKNRDGFRLGGFLPPKQHYAVKKFGYFDKQRQFSLEICPISPRQVDGIVNKLVDETVELVDDACVGRLVVSVYYTLVSCNPLTPLPRLTMIGANGVS